MLNTVQYSTHSTPLLYSPFYTGTSTVLSKVTYKTCENRNNLRSRCIRCSTDEDVVRQAIEQSVLTATSSPTTVKAVVSAKYTVGGRLAHVGIDGGLDDIGDLFGKSLLLELISSEHDPNTIKEKVQAYACRGGLHGDEMKYEATFLIPSGFGEIGGVLVQNEHHKEMYLNHIILTTGDETTAINMDCRSWVHSKFDNPEKRIFFTTKSYLPPETPKGLIVLREKELETIRGNGKGERKHFERIYDYDTYNDLGHPKNARPVLGGSKDLPYPRRCRTGREKTDDGLEKRSNAVYIPRDESFWEVKQVTFSAKTLRSVLHALVPSIETAIVDSRLGFDHFKHIDMLYNEGVTLPKLEGTSAFKNIVPRLIKTLQSANDVLLFETPAMIEKDKFSWLKDEEFSRQTLAGLNPISIQLVTEFPIVSKLDPEIYGDPESLITADVIDHEIRGIMTAQQALEQKKLFMLDYHDLLLPLVHKVREQEGTTLYGSRTLFILTPINMLRPIAIELTRPKSPTKPQWKQVFMPAWDSTGAWLWKLAKVHVNAHDSGYHQLVSHWLRTHCCTEPYVIAMNRQLSVMHPVYRLMHPHFRYTMEINALAREFLVNANGIIETAFAPGKHSIELSSVAYREQWRFDMEALPADLIRRGMAVEDPTAEHGLKLTIEDYPYANDGLLIWSSIKEWVTDYINHYYPTPNHIQEDYELQNWWTEVRTKGHGDKKDEPWWPVLNTQDDLVHVITTIIWVTSGHHAAVNFGQYHYAGYFPNRPTTARVNMPTEDVHSEQFKQFWDKPEATLLKCYPSQIQATVVMAVLDILSTHSPDEEYMGDKPEPAWTKDLDIYAAFERFNERLKEIDGIIDARNVNPELKNRCGAGIVPYELLKPFSEPGVTAKGIPNSISI